MAAELNQDAVLGFLQSRGGSVRNSALLQHFAPFIRNHEHRDRNRELFKKFVNTVATVRTEDGVSFVVLRKKHRGAGAPGAAAGGAGGGPGAPRLPAGRSPEPRPDNSNLSATKTPTPAPVEEPATSAFLPAAGILPPNNSIRMDLHPDLNQQQDSIPEIWGGTAVVARKDVVPRGIPGGVSGFVPAVVARRDVAPGEVHGFVPAGVPSVVARRDVVPGEVPGLVPLGLPAVVARRDVAPMEVPGFVPAVVARRDVAPREVPGFVPVVVARRDVAPREVPGFVPVVVARRDVAPGEVPGYIPAVVARKNMVPGGAAAGFPGMAPGVVSGMMPTVVAQKDLAPGVVPTRFPSVVSGVVPSGVPTGVPSQFHGLVPARLSSGVPAGFPGVVPGVVPLRVPGVVPVDVPAVVPRVVPARLPPVDSSGFPGVVPVGVSGVVPGVVPRMSEHSVRREYAMVGQQSLCFGPLPGTTAGVPTVTRQDQQQQRVSLPETYRSKEVDQQPVAVPHQEPPPPSQVAPRRLRYRPSYKSAVSQDDTDGDEEEDEEEQEEVTLRRASEGGVWPSRVPLEDMRRTLSASTPCITESSAPPSITSSSSNSSSARTLPQIFVQPAEEDLQDPASSSESGMDEGPISSRRRWPSDAEHRSPSPQGGSKEALPHRYAPQEQRFPQAPPQPTLHQTQREELSSFHSSISTPPPSSGGGFSSRDWPPSGSPRGSPMNCSYEDLPAAAGGAKILEALNRAQRTMSVTDLDRLEVADARLRGDHRLTHHSKSNDHLYDNQEGLRRLSPWRLSTSDVSDERHDAESSDGSVTSVCRPPVVRRLNSQLRSRMCLSLGADLDQLLQEELRVEGGATGGGAGGRAGGSEAARLNRLHLLSSSLSLRYTLSSSSLSSCSTPPRCHSVGDLLERAGPAGGGAKTPDTSVTPPPQQQQHGVSRQSLVPLEPREHVWLVKAASGAWPDIYGLFREDPSLLNKQDFISGFTVLHWIAKHGDHRVLNTLWYGVQKAGLGFDVNARSSCGHTPLHVAATHGHKSVLRLLVNKFRADVRLRDVSGKRAWHYLSGSAPLDVFQLLGAPARAALGGAGKGAEPGWEQPHEKQRRRRRHRFSTASSGQRPLTVAGTVRVKRSSSIAALLKRKSLLRFHAHASDV